MSCVERAVSEMEATGFCPTTSKLSPAGSKKGGVAGWIEGGVAGGGGGVLLAREAGRACGGLKGVRREVWLGS